MLDKSRDFECKVYKYIHWLSPAILKHKLGSSENEECFILFFFSIEFWPQAIPLEMLWKRQTLSFSPCISQFTSSLSSYSWGCCCLCEDLNSSCRTQVFSSKNPIPSLSHSEQRQEQGEKSFLSDQYLTKQKLDLNSMGLPRVGHDWSNLAAAAAVN